MWPSVWIRSNLTGTGDCVLGALRRVLLVLDYKPEQRALVQNAAGREGTVVSICASEVQWKEDRERGKTGSRSG